MNQFNDEKAYTMGRSPQETERLIQQAQLYGDLTKRFFQEAGISKGMKVLDIGSGAGDVAIALAEMVGSEGEVVGVDVNEEILQSSRKRAKQAGFENITFIEGDFQTLSFEGQFDAVVGRLVLMYVSDPALALRKFSTYLRPGGIIAFQELDLRSLWSFVEPATPLLNKLKQWCIEVVKRSGANAGMGLDLYGAFLDAGLPEPSMYLSAPMGRIDTGLGFEFLANSFRSMLPLMENYGVATAKDLDVDTLAERLRTEVVISKRPLLLPPHITAWVQIPSS